MKVASQLHSVHLFLDKIPLKPLCDATLRGVLYPSFRVLEVVRV